MHDCAWSRVVITEIDNQSCHTLFMLPQRIVNLWKTLPRYMFSISLSIFKERYVILNLLIEYLLTLHHKGILACILLCICV